MSRIAHAKSEIVQANCGGVYVGGGQEGMQNESPLRTGIKQGINALVRQLEV